MTAFDGARDNEDPGLDMRRLAASGAVTHSRSRARRWLRLWSIYGPLAPIALGLGMLAGTAIVVLL